VRNATGFALLLVLGSGACTDATAPTRLTRAPSASQSAVGDHPEPITVISRNMYIGADVDLVISALISPNPADDLPALLESIRVLQRTDFPARVNALADEIAHARPQVVGLQEVEDVSIDLRGIGFPTQIELHFLPMLEAALAERGLNYVVAAQVLNTIDAPFPGLTVIDNEVMLVDADRVTVGPNVIARSFAANIGQVAPGIFLRRGWVQVDANIEGVPVTIASTHTEPFGPPQLRAAQVQQLIGSIGNARRAIMIGDFNDDPSSLMHSVITSQGYRDVWSEANPGDPGLTCCHLADLSNAESVLARRIDYVFERGMGDPLKAKATLVGEESKDRVPGPLYPVWPSDHAGVVVKFHPVTPNSD
jgi:endonuclease/exonuclease/phosphatase family metal-dependent hydrolase